MEMMATTIPTTSYWNNISSDQLFDMDDLFSSTFSLLTNDDCMMIKAEYDEASSSSEIDQEQLQTSLTTNVPQESHLTDLICGVCGAPAHGYNFDQITCESCKAFFRRNALRDRSRLKCRFSGSCTINIRTRRQCTYCRLNKCFDIKMRKDWIRTEEERELRELQKLAKVQKKLNKTTKDQEPPPVNLPLVIRKKKRLIIKPTMKEFLLKPIFTQKVFGFNRNLPDEYQILFNNITNTYQLASDQAGDFRIDTYVQSLSLIDFINEESKTHESLIKFYKLIPQFKQLELNDQIRLIKFNLVKIVHLHCILMQKFQEDPLIGFYMSKWINEDFHHQMSRTRAYFDRFIEHPLVLKLALVIFIFNTNLSTPDSIDLVEDYTNKKYIREIQDYYTTVLWHYLNYLFEEKEAIKSMEIIITQLLHYQTLMDIMKEYIKRDKISKISNPLEISLFRLT